MNQSLRQQCEHRLSELGRTLKLEERVKEELRNLESVEKAGMGENAVAGAAEQMEDEGRALMQQVEQAEVVLRCMLNPFPLNSTSMVVEHRMRLLPILNSDVSYLVSAFLPPESLWRIRLVSRSWYTAAYSQAFRFSIVDFNRHIDHKEVVISSYETRLSRITTQSEGHVLVAELGRRVHQIWSYLAFLVIDLRKRRQCVPKKVQRNHTDTLNALHAATKEIRCRLHTRQTQIALIKQELSIP